MLMDAKVAHNKPWESARFGLYARVSTPEQKASLDSQLTSLRREVTLKKGRIVAVLSDVGTGARSKQRRDYQTMLKLVGGQQIDYLYIRDISRLSRKFGTLEELWHFCRQNGVVIVDQQVGVITGLFLWALGMVAQLMRGVQGEQVRNSLAVKARKGLHVGRAPIGYECVEIKGEKGHLEKVPDEAKLVQRIFKRALSGMSLRGQAWILNFKERVPSPGGSLWSSEGVRYILSNQVYRKDILWGRTRTYFHAISEAFQRDDVDEVDWIRAIGTHEALVSGSDFDQVQAILARNESQYKPRKAGPPVFLSGLIKCPDCSKVDADGNVLGGTMSVVSADGRRSRMRCSNASAGKCNNRRTFYRDHILEAILGGLLDHLKSPKAITMFIEEHEAACETRLKQAGRSRRKAEKRIKTLETEIKRLVDRLADGENADELQTGISDRKTEKFELMTQLDDIENWSVTFKVSSRSLADYAAMAERMMANLSGNEGPEDIELREYLEALVKHVYVYPLQPKGFEVEVFGKLANLVTGSLSYRAEHRKGSLGKDILTKETLTISRAAEKLVMAFPRKGGPSRKPRRKHDGRRPEPELVRILSGSAVPMTASAIVGKLAEKGLKRTITSVHLALDRRPEQFVHVRKNGFMLRSRWERQPLRYFLTTAEIVAMARVVVDVSPRPMRPQEIIDQFHAKGRKIFGAELRILQIVLSKHASDFEAKGRRFARWILRTSPGLAPSALAA
jgi:DNA invertase Pin-like site-specific DNA recombinase